MAVPRSRRRPSQTGAHALWGQVDRALRQHGMQVRGEVRGGGQDAPHGSNKARVGNIEVVGEDAVAVLDVLADEGLLVPWLGAASSGVMELRVVAEEGLQAQHVALRLRLPVGAEAAGGRWWQRRRWRYPAGLSVALLGPDGTGKSTVARACCKRLQHLFTGTHVQHLRPSVLPALQRLANPRQWGRPGGQMVVTDPHGKPAAGGLSSLLRLAYYSGDYLVGYVPRLYWPAVQGRLVMFDRYHPDLLADPLRWRIGLPTLPRQLATRALPLPDLVVLLDGPAAMLHARKEELSPDEIARQLVVYRALVGRLSNGYVVSVEPAPELVVTAVCKLVVRRQAGMVRRRMQSFRGKESNS
ncbi:MAG TPA: hypothetical protein ENK23_04910 [Sorangium sp.]|nr:hypothetical protein [Sorangium sp.]